MLSFPWFSTALFFYDVYWCHYKSVTKLVTLVNICIYIRMLLYSVNQSGIKQGRYCTCNVILWRFRLSIVASEALQCVPLNCWDRRSLPTMYQVLKEVAMVTHQCVVLIVALRISLPAGVHVKCPIFLSHFNQIWMFLYRFSWSHQYHILCIFV